MSKRPIALLVAAGAACLFAGNAPAASPGRFADTVTEILAQPYQPAYLPAGDDAAFAPAEVPNTAPAQDYTTGSIPGSPDAPAWPAAFRQVTIASGDGAPLLAQLALHAEPRPGIVVVHGFNTHGYASVVRWAAMLYASGYDVIAADQRDFGFEYDASQNAAPGSPFWQYTKRWPQTFGWKESEDVLAAGRYLAARTGVTSVGVVGFSEGAANTILALALDARSPAPVFAAALTFSAPADQDTQIFSTAVPAGCSTPLCTYPATQALVLLVVPPYSTGDPCTVLANAGSAYGTDGFSILSHETPFHAQKQVDVPLLNVYANDDSLVAPFQASMMAAYEAGAPQQQTILLARGEHAYFFDRWWQQRAILTYFKGLLPGAWNDASLTTSPTVSRTPGGAPAGAQTVDLGAPSPAWADAQLAPYVCDTGRGAPGAAGGS